MNLTDLFNDTKRILEKDSVLCNYFRYIDYGELKKNNSADNIIIWNSIDNDVINYNNNINKTQCIRFVPKLDVKFLKNLSQYNSNSLSENNSDINIYNKWSDPIKHFWDYISRQHLSYYNNDNLNDILNYLTQKMFNIDCTFEIKGSSLTVLDFVGKNAKFTTDEYNWWNNFLFKNIKKLIFIGDKCFLLCIVDTYNNIWVSTKILEYVYETVPRKKYKEIVLKMFNVFNRIIINNLKFSIPQYINDEITIGIIKKFVQSHDSNILNCDSEDFVSIMDFDFSDNVDINIYIKENIKYLIHESVSECIKQKYKFDEFNMGDYLRSLRNMFFETMKKSNNISFMNGLLVNSLINQTGWNCIPNVLQDPNYGYLNLDPAKQYIYKDVDIVPIYAVITNYDNHNYFNKDVEGYRKLKDEYRNKIMEYSHITRLYIDLNSGNMLAVGSHPNVSSGHQVCMGDLKGKISFSNSTPEELIEMLNSCEQLLYTINYTSSYNENAKSLFLNSDYSTEAFNDNNINTKTIADSSKLIKDVSSISDDGFEEMSEDSDSEIVQNVVNTPEAFESDDFEEEE